jgi:hypothetical protein
MPRWGPGRLNRYGDLMVRDPTGCGDWVAGPEDDIARMLGGDGARPDSEMTQRRRTDVIAA